MINNNIIWKYITDLSVQGIDKNRYKISEFGEVWDDKNKKYPSIIIDDEGYHRVYLHTSHGFKLNYIHRLVKIEFDGLDTDPLNNQVDHKDCNKSHNYPSNLEWVSRRENSKRAIKNNLYPQFNLVIDENDAKFICEKLKEGMNYKSISDLLFEKYGQSTVGIIGKIYRGERWKEISEQYMPFPKLEKDLIFSKNSKLNSDIIEDICRLLDSGIGITKTARLIEKKYSINRDLENTIGFIKRGKTWKSISSKYNFIKDGEIEMSKSEQTKINDFEENIKNYSNKIEHIDSFVEAVRRFPGK